MKKGIKNILKKTNLYDPAYDFYCRHVRGVTPAVLAREIAFHTKGAPDGLPLPPGHLIYLVIGFKWSSIFWDYGKAIVDDMKAILRRNGINIEDCENILEFGCGCGRLTRHFKGLQNTEVFGTDYNGELIAWCKKSLTFGQFNKNELQPPLKYADNTFNFIYARSVFTHLDENLQHRWMTELRRVLKPGGVLYFSTHGESYVDSLPLEGQNQYRAGQIILVHPELSGKNEAAAYHPPEFVKQKLLNSFQFLEFIPGEKTGHARQDIYLARKTA